MSVESEVTNAYREALGRDPTPDELASEVDNASRYGEDWLNNQLDANLAERNAPTASAGGSGGDIDLNGDGIVDAGWFAIGGSGDNVGWVQSGDLDKVHLESGAGFIVDAGGLAAGAVVPQVETLYGARDAFLHEDYDKQVKVISDSGISDGTGRADSSFYIPPSLQRFYGATSAKQGSTGAPGNSNTASNVAANPYTMVRTAGTTANPQSASSALIAGAGGGTMAAGIGGGGSKMLLLLAAGAALYFHFRK